MGQEQYRAALASLLPCLTALRLLATRWTAATTWSLLSNLQSDLVSQQVWARVKPCYHNLLHLVRQKFLVAQHLCIQTKLPTGFPCNEG